MRTNASVFHMDKKTIDIDGLIKDFGFDQPIIESFNHVPESTEALTIWIPSAYKAKFDLIQMHSRKKFSRVLRQLIKTAIDKVEV